MPPERRAPVAIVGAGFSGTMLAAQLARRQIASLLIDGSGREGRGTAYSTAEPAHLLNVRADAMSAWPDAPGDFAAYCGEPRGFAERRLFGRYLREILDEAVATGHVELIRASAVEAANDGGWVVRLDDGGECHADALALANGNQPPEPLRAADGAGERFVNNPWGAEARRAVAEVADSGEDVLLVGTGLTMVDMVLSLDAAGHRGRIVALSRRGQIPRAHREFEPAPVGLEEVPAGEVRAMTRWLRGRSAQAGFRAAVDSLRPHSQALWQGLDLAQQRRFLRHARPWWDVHRHRIAPEVAQRLVEMIGEGRLEVVAGRIAAMRSDGDGLAVSLRRRGRAEADTESRFAFAFNCTGPLGAVARTRDPLLRGLIDRGAIRPDRLGIGLAVDERARAADRLWALGPLTKGRYWEIVAVPDIRGQAAAVADDIARELQQ